MDGLRLSIFLSGGEAAAAVFPRKPSGVSGVLTEILEKSTSPPGMGLDDLGVFWKQDGGGCLGPVVREGGSSFVPTASCILSLESQPPHCAAVCEFPTSLAQSLCITNLFWRPGHLGKDPGV